MTVTGFADSGAQMTVISPEMVHSLGVKDEELLNISMVIKAASNANLQVKGGIVIKKFLGADSKGKVREARQLAYIAAGTNQFFVFKKALIDPGLLKQNFLLPQSGLEEAGDVLLAQDDKSCKCLVRESPPEPPMELPMPATK